MRSRDSLNIRTLAFAVGVLASVSALAQSVDEKAKFAVELIGITAFSLEGAEVGTVSAVTVGADGEITEIRLTPSPLLSRGQGRIVAVPSGLFVALDGAVVLDLTAAEVDSLPTPQAPQLKTSA